MKNKKKTKKTFIERVTLRINLMQTIITILIVVLFFINSIQLANINKNLKMQTDILIQISDFLQNRFEVEKPSPQMVEIVGLK